jgi:hypothetical protein
MNADLERRLCILECVLVPMAPAPAFVMVADHSTAAREMERLKSEHGDRLPPTLFIMICAGADRSSR